MHLKHSRILQRGIRLVACATVGLWLSGSFLTGAEVDSPRCRETKDAGLLHVDYTGSQMQFVEDYLATHSRVVAMTLQLGGNDFQNFARGCRGNFNQSLEPVRLEHGVDVAPVFERFLAATLPFGGNSCAAGLLITNADGTCNIHPTPAGHQLIASIIAEVLGEIDAPAAK